MAVMNTLYFIEDVYTEQYAFRNMTEGSKSIMEKLCKEAKILITSDSINTTTKEAMEDMVELCQDIISDACILNPHKLFAENE